MSNALLAATLKPRMDRRDDRLEVWVDVLCRDRKAAWQLREHLGLPGSVRGSVLRVRTPVLGKLVRKLGLRDLSVEAAADALDHAFRRVVPCPAPVRAEREEAMGRFAMSFAIFVEASLNDAG
jgi:hypothetical protein